jgi:hypothetical protein
MNYKDSKPYMSAFLSFVQLTDFAAYCLTHFMDWRYIHSWFVFSTQLVAPWTKEQYLCTVAHLLYLLSDLLPPPPLPNVHYSIYTDSVWPCVTGGGGAVGGGGGVEMYCGPYSAGAVVGKMTTFDIWPIPLGGGALGQICDILRPQLAMNSFLPLWPHRFPHFGYIHCGGGGMGGLWY